jgi:hypothetical protein
VSIDGLFETVATFPDPAFQRRYEALVGLDSIKERLEKEAEALLRPDLLDKWSTEKHGVRLSALDLFLNRPPLFIFAGDVGTGKTELASTFGDRLARTTKLPVELFCLSLRARGSGAVGEMTRLISDAFCYIRSHAAKKISGDRKTGSTILLIDEADALAQSRELAQMHHEDRAGVNALIRGIDDIAVDRLACLTTAFRRLIRLCGAGRRQSFGLTAPEWNSASNCFRTSWPGQACQPPTSSVSPRAWVNLKPAPTGIPFQTSHSASFHPLCLQRTRRVVFHLN